MRRRDDLLRLAAMLASCVCVPGMAAAQQTTRPETQPAPPPAVQPETPPVAGGPSGGEASATAVKKSAEEEIIVTGSRVRRKDLTTPAPVTIISREQISASGIASIGDFLQQMPEQTGGLNTNVNNGGDGQTQISLRNIGAQRTLVLVDGKRWVNGGSGAGSAVDLNSIPASAIERVEVLKDGASAVYGSDAIGGVVNIITRRRVNGVEASAYTGASPHGDAQQYDVSVTGGTVGDRGSFLFTAGYFDQKSMFASARDWATKALIYDFTNGEITPGGSSRIPQGRFRVNPANCSTPLCAALLAKFGAGSKNFMFDPTNPNSVNGFRVFNAATDLYNYQAVNYLITPNTRMQLFSNGDYRLADFARAYFQGSFVNRQSSYLIAPEPFDTGSFSGQSNTTIKVDKNNQFNPFGVDIFDARRRLVETGGRSQGFDLDTIRGVAGIDGTLPESFGPLQGVFWDVSFNFGRTSGVTTTQGSLNVQRVNDAIGPSFKDANGVWHCGDPNATTPVAIPNCTPVNLFGGPGTITPDMLTAMGGYKGINQGWTQLASLQANVSAELFRLAAERPAGLAIGYEHRNEYGGYIPNAIAQARLDSDFNGQATQGSFYVNEGYAELDIPVVSNMPLAEDVELQAAIRVFDYSTFGSGQTHKFGARWRPIHDLTLRGTFSTGFRAPGVTDLYGGQGPSAESATDPCGVPDPANTKLNTQCGAAYNNGDDNVQINSTVGGNTKLQPEKAQIGTVGAVIQPSMVPGLSLTVDYWNVQIYRLIGAIGTQVILNACYPSSVGSSGAANADLCNLITRDPVTQQIRNVSDLSTNVGRLITSGVDFALRYTVPTDFGRFGFLFDSTYLINYDLQVATGQVYKSAGNYDIGSQSATGGLTPRIKFNAGVDYSLAGFNAGLRGRFIGAYRECADAAGLSAGGAGPGFCSDHTLDPATITFNPDGTFSGTPLPSRRVSAYMTADLFLSYLLRTPVGRTTLSAGVRNLFDTQPPLNYNSFLTYADTGYDFTGRFLYARLSQQF